jgi:hypothetical protein
MSKRLLRFFAIVGLLCVPRSVCAQENPADVRGCDLAGNPKAFDGKLIRVRGTLNVYFEDFSLGIKNCDAHQGIWLAFGGDVPGIVASLVNDDVKARRHQSGAGIFAYQVLEPFLDSQEDLNPTAGISGIGGGLY